MIKSLVIIFSLYLFFLLPDKTYALERYWDVQSIDTMKYSRDRARDKETFEKIPVYVKQVADLHPNYIAIGTPYDEEFYPVLRKWVTEARKHNLKVWFRGNFSSWEGWFGYPKFGNSNEHHEKLPKFISDNAGYFEDGDIFTPAPEPENGIIGDPRSSKEKSNQYKAFLIDSYKTCNSEFQKFNAKVTCGYFSMNGDIAKNVLDKETVNKTGGVVVIDHYVRSPQILSKDIQYLHSKFGAKVVLGEFGAPVPDIHGSMSDSEQSEYIISSMRELMKVKDMMKGLNYWTAFDSSTSLINSTGSVKPVGEIVNMYYSPRIISGRVYNTLSEELSGVIIRTHDNIVLGKTDSKGEYIVSVVKEDSILFVKEKYRDVKKEFNTSDENADSTVYMSPEFFDVDYEIKLFIHNINKIL